MDIIFTKLFVTVVKEAFHIDADAEFQCYKPFKKTIDT